MGSVRVETCDVLHVADGSTGWALSSHFSYASAWSQFLKCSIFTAVGEVYEDEDKADSVWGYHAIAF